MAGLAPGGSATSQAVLSTKRTESTTGAAWRDPATAASPNLLGHLSGCKGTRQHYKPSLDPSQVFHPSFRVSHTSSPARASARLGTLQVAQPHLGAAERLRKPGRPGGPSPAPPDGPSRLHLEAIRKSLSPCLTTSLGNAASTTRPFSCRAAPDPCCLRSRLAHLRPCRGCHRQVG